MSENRHKYSSQLFFSVFRLVSENCVVILHEQKES